MGWGFAAEDGDEVFDLGLEGGGGRQGIPVYYWVVFGFPGLLSVSDAVIVAEFCLVAEGEGGWVRSWVVASKVEERCWTTTSRTEDVIGREGCDAV